MALITCVLHVRECRSQCNAARSVTLAAGAYVGPLWFAFLGACYSHCRGRLQPASDLYLKSSWLEIYWAATMGSYVFVVWSPPLSSVDSVSFFMSRKIVGLAECISPCLLS